MFSKKQNGRPLPVARHLNFKFEIGDFQAFASVAAGLAFSAARATFTSSANAAASVAAMSAGSPDSATQRNGPLPSQNSGRT